MGFSQGRGGGGGTPLYLPYRHVPPQRGMDFAYFGLNLGKIFKGIQEYGTCLSFERPNRKRDRVISEFEMDFKNLFAGVLI